MARANDGEPKPAPVDEIDPRVALLVEALRLVPGVFTFSSCGGHDDAERHGRVPLPEYFVCFYLPRSARGWAALDRVAWACQMAEAETDGEIRLVAWWNGDCDEPYDQEEGPALCFEVHGYGGADPDVLADIIGNSIVEGGTT